MSRQVPYQIFYWALPLLFFFAVRFGLNYNGLYGQDSHEYLRFSQALIQYFQDGDAPGFFYWPWGFPLAGAFLSWLCPSSAFALQLVSTLSMVGLLFVSHKLLLLFYPGKHAPIVTTVLLAIGVSPIMAAFGVNVMSDLQAAFLCTTSIYFFTRYRLQGLSFAFFVGAFFALLAINSRFPTGILMLLPAGLAYLKAVRLRHVWPIVIGPLFLGMWFLFQSLSRPEHAMDLLQNSYFQDWSFTHFFQSDFTSADGHIGYTLPNLIFSAYPFFYPSFFLGMLPLVAWTIFKKKIHSKTWPIWGSGILFLLFAAGLPFQNQRVLLLAYPLFIILIVPGILMLKDRLSRILKFWLVLASFGTQILLFGLFLNSFYQSQQTQMRIAATLKKFPDQIIYTTAVEMSFPAYGVENEVISIWEDRYTKLKPNGVLLYNNAAFGVQWANKNPGKTWSDLQKNGHLDTLHTLPRGWVLYRWKANERSGD